MTWEIYSRGTIPFYRLAMYVKSSTSLSGKLTGTSFKEILSASEGGEYWWCWRKEEIGEIAKKIVERLPYPEKIKEEFEKIDQYIKKVLSSAQEIMDMDLESLSNDEIIMLYNKHIEICNEPYAYLGVVIDAVDLYPSEWLKNLLRKRLKDISDTEFNKIYSDLTKPAYLSYVKEEENALLKVVIKIKRGELSRDNVIAEIEPIKKKFWWTTLGWESMKTRKEDDFLSALDNYLKDIDDPEAYLSESLKIPQNVKKRKKEIIEKYNLNDIAYLFPIFDKYTEFHDYRKEKQVKIMYAFYLLLEVVSKRIHVPVEDLEWYWYDEVCRFLLGEKYDPKETIRRKKAFLVHAVGKDVRTYSGFDAISKRKELMEDEDHDVDEIVGTAASSGKVTGIARVCSGVKEALEKVKRGDVLVCGMTLPDYVPAMKMAAAIVTNEGGITCHAAIISRELGIPCVIGTGIATKVLKDGDLIEVDANHGVVKVVK